MQREVYFTKMIERQQNKKSRDDNEGGIIGEWMVNRETSNGKKIRCIVENKKRNMCFRRAQNSKEFLAKHNGLVRLAIVVARVLDFFSVFFLFFSWSFALVRNCSMKQQSIARWPL